MRYAAFVRGVMIGRKHVTRALLEREFLRAGARNAGSFLATGNIFFDADSTKVPGIIAATARALNASIGLEQPIFVRSFRTLEKLRALDPFREHRASKAFEYCVSFLPQKTSCDFALPFTSQREDFVLLNASGDHVFSVTYRINGRPGNPNAWLERQLQTRVTTRNWRTVERLLDRFGG